MKFQVNNQKVTITKHEALVSGSVNIFTAEFEFDSTWDGYSKIAVFAARNKENEVRKEAALSKDACVIPWEVLAEPGKLKVGVYGVSGDKRLPTVYTDDEIILLGAEASDPAAEPTPGVIEQFVAQTAKDREAAEAAAERAEEAATHQPYPSAETGTWWVWDAESGEYKDSGVPYGGGNGSAYQMGPGLTLDPGTNTLSVDTADAVEQDNTKPVTSAAVYTEIGNIEALLAAL